MTSSVRIAVSGRPAHLWPHPGDGSVMPVVVHVADAAQLEAAVADGCEVAIIAAHAPDLESVVHRLRAADPDLPVLLAPGAVPAPAVPPLLAAGALQLGTAHGEELVRAVAVAAARREMRRLLRLQQTVAAAVSTSTDAAHLCREVVTAVCCELGWDRGAVWRRDGRDGWQPAAASGTEADSLRPVTDSRSSWVTDHTDPPSTRVQVPLVAGGVVEGALVLQDGSARAHDGDVLAALSEVASQLAQSLARGRSHQTLVRQDRALAAITNGVVIGDATRPGFPIVYVNPGFERLTGYRAEDVIGRPCSLLQGPGTDAQSVALMTAALSEQRECRVTLLNYRADGSPFWNEVFLSPVFDADGHLLQYAGVQSDVTERRRAEDQATYLAYHDSLTGLANRALLQRHLARALERARAHDLSAALLYLDLDDFKAVNDRLGHAAGDQLLEQVARRLAGAVRAGDLLARQGGDEFLVLLSDLAGDARTQAAEVAERAVAALSSPFTLEGVAVRVGVSIGISVFPDDAGNADTILRHADAAMYDAKRSPDRSYSLFQRRAHRPRTALGNRAPQGEAAVSADALTALEGVLAEGRVSAVYQPIVELDSGAVVAHEALARGPEGSPVARPDALFAAGERAGRLGELDWLCRTTALEGALDAGVRSAVFVNVEPAALGTPCPSRHAEVWERSRGLDVVFEITERSLTAKPAELLHTLEAVRARGWRVAIDDVGADTRSLALMPLLRPDVIKLDLRLVQQQPTAEIAAIVNAVNAEHERTGAVVLAEGIETEAHLATARAMGASLGQGWLFGRPGALDTGGMAGWLRRHEVAEPAPGTTPYDVVGHARPVRRADKALLLSISHHLEDQAAALGGSAVVLSAFQDAGRFTPATHRRYTLLAAEAAFVAALGVGMRPEPAPGVRGAALRADDRLAGEWSIAVVGPHFAAALVAVDLGDTGPDRERRFDYALTYDRDLVVAAASTLMRRVRPLGASTAR